jgi:hypothetical protein
MTWEMERFRAENERQRENSARLASAYADYLSDGQGSIEFGRRARFGVTFVDQPFVSYCAAVDLDALSEQLGLDPKDDAPIPVVSGVVTDWDQDDRGFWTGAWVGVNVYFPPTSAVVVGVDINVRCHHFFTFTAVAIKDIPLDLID